MLNQLLLGLVSVVAVWGTMVPLVDTLRNAVAAFDKDAAEEIANFKVMSNCVQREVCSVSLELMDKCWDCSGGEKFLSLLYGTLTPFLGQLSAIIKGLQPYAPDVTYDLAGNLSEQTGLLRRMFKGTEPQVPKVLKYIEDATRNSESFRSIIAELNSPTQDVVLTAASTASEQSIDLSVVEAGKSKEGWIARMMRNNLMNKGAPPIEDGSIALALRAVVNKARSDIDWSHDSSQRNLFGGVLLTWAVKAAVVLDGLKQIYVPKSINIIHKLINTYIHPIWFQLWVE